MVETWGVNEDQVAVGLWVFKLKMSDSKVSGQRVIVGGSECCSSGNVNELLVSELLEPIENKGDADLRGFCLLQSAPTNSRPR